MYIFKDNNFNEVRCFSNDSIEEILKKQNKLRKRQAEAFRKALERRQYQSDIARMKRRIESDLKLKKQIEESKRPLKEKLAGFSKDLINSAKDASIKAGRNAKAGLLHGMRKVSDSLRH